MKPNTHLRYSYETAGMEYHINKHAMEVFKELGITYQHSTPQSMGAQYWFWNCQNIPNELPGYITVLNVDPMDCIGHGLSEEDAIKIRRGE